MGLESVRLKKKELDLIVESFREHFDEKNNHLWLFGSRTNPDARGGDIDLYIETDICDPCIIFSKRTKFVMSLFEKIGEQKIDIVINMLSSSVKLPIYNVARESGVLLV